MCFDSFENPSGSHHCWIDQVSRDILYAVVERARGVNNGIEWRRRLDSLVESSFSCYVVDNGTSSSLISIHVEQKLPFAWGANCGHDFMAMSEKSFQEMDANEAASSS